jgi:hypothetical protein
MCEVFSYVFLVVALAAVMFCGVVAISSIRDL